jgi:uncharacterized protein (TIGR02594 family)
MENRELMWLEMMKYYGLSEIPGEIDNPIIVGWFKELGFPEVQDDETAWCSLLMNITCKRIGLPYTGKLNARSWARLGKQIILPYAKIGHVVIFWRNKRTSWEGHVGLFAGLSEDKKTIYTLGGNQSNKVGVNGFPKESDTFGLLDIREI